MSVNVSSEVQAFGNRVLALEALIDCREHARDAAKALDRNQAVSERDREAHHATIMLLAVIEDTFDAVTLTTKARDDA